MTHNAETTSCEERLAACQQKAEEYLAGWQRANADYQNLQKETARSMHQMQQFANEELLVELLPLVDHFKYAFKGIPEKERTSAWVQGIDHIFTNLLRILRDHGITMMKTDGEKFQPSLHESVEEVPSDAAHGTIVEEVGSGFTLHGKVIQSAKVKVAK